jgi:hypothetical protein
MAKYILTGDSRDIPLAASMLLAIEQMFEEHKIASSGGNTWKSPSVKRKDKARVILYFLENKADVEEGYSPLDGEISFRLMNYTIKNMTMEKAIEVGKKIKSKFGKPPFVWKKGKEMLTYTHWEKGYQLQILCPDINEGKRIAEQALDIQSFSPDWEYANHITNLNPVARYPTIPDKETVLNESIRLPRERGVGRIVFQYAHLELPPLREPYLLYDATGKLPNPLVDNLDEPKQVVSK